jgi:hypothetical protein
VGVGAEEETPRWSVVRNVLGWEFDDEEEEEEVHWREQIVRLKAGVNAPAPD